MKTIFKIIILISLNLCGAQVQIGQDIDGDEGLSESVWSVSLSSDGNIVAIGTPYNAGNVGKVSIYRYASCEWTQIGDDIHGEAISDLSGRSISLSSDGSIVAIGAIGNDGNGNSSGHVRLYENLSGTWTQIGNDIDGEAANDRSGYSVSLSDNGNIVAIGATENDGKGHVRVYENLAGTWTQIGVDIDGEALGDLSGYSISLSSNGMVLAIGAPENDRNGTDSGHVRTYEYISGTWIQTGGDIDGENSLGRSGQSVSLSSDGSIIAIGAQGNNGNGADSGHVRIYENRLGVWTQIGNDIDGEAEGNLFGYSVDLSNDGSIVAIGARLSDVNGPASGHVKVFQNISGSWIQIGDTINGVAPGDNYGFSVSLSADGNRLAIGARNSRNNNRPGHVRVFSFSSELTPVFDVVDQICEGDTLGPLPTTSINGITGTWSPALDTTTTTTYTFTPNMGECANSIRLTIDVNTIVDPVFDVINPIIGGTSLDPLPTTSNNGITGTWSPTLDNTATTTYTFTPNAGECANSTTITIVVDDSIVPECTTLILPTSGGFGIPINTDLEWNVASNATGYRLRIGTSSGASDILNALDVGDVTAYDFVSDLPNNTNIFVTIMPYNDNGDALSCSEYFFMTEGNTFNSELPPKFFTPNNDTINDSWVVPNTENNISSIFIYDRYGKLLKEILDPSTGWDGIFNGKLMMASEYWYKIVYNDGTLFTGHFSLVR
ncbi:T9SS type B sorting domain-containing protein [Seonamhaeicola sp. ML3]|uniref:T9SS type B sorting domain-containing protein n=1 Tax=Seonamhaeicola sp. ML3 TaxID=2937786 RepID=UPI00201067C5|nr:T9SS type B sorting domain-containing protein [Seonamhaeicola sp. ML3]